MLHYLQYSFGYKIQTWIIYSHYDTKLIGSVVRVGKMQYNIINKIYWKRGHWKSISHASSQFFTDKLVQLWWIIFKNPLTTSPAIIIIINSPQYIITYPHYINYMTHIFTIHLALPSNNSGAILKYVFIYVHRFHFFLDFGNVYTCTWNRKQY